LKFLLRFFIVSSLFTGGKINCCANEDQEGQNAGYKLHFSIFSVHEYGGKNNKIKKAGVS
jgi:hypothetical protein